MIPVQQSTDVSSISKRQQGRTIPGFHRARRPVVEVSFFGWHGLIVLPGLGDHGHYGFGQRTLTRVDQKFQNAIGRPRVRQIRFHHRVKLFDVVEVLAFHHTFPSGHEVHVTTHRVNLTVVRQHSKRDRYVLYINHSLI